MSTPKPSVSLPQSVYAIALDANCMGKGRYIDKEVDRTDDVLIEQEFDHVEIWVPEPVLWEWAEHRHSDIKRAAAEYNDAASRARGALLPGVPDIKLTAPDIEEVLMSLRTQFTRYFRVRVLPLNEFPHAAIEGLRDQVLQKGTGRRKHDQATGKAVKTGASDSAAWRLVQGAADTRIEDVVLVTRDSDVGMHDWAGKGPIVVDSLHRVRQELLGLMPGTEAAKQGVREAIEAQLPSIPEDDLRSVPIEDGHTVFAYDSDRTFHEVVSLIAITNVGSITDIDVSKSDNFASAEAAVLVSLELEIAWWSEETEDVHQTQDEVHDLPATAQLSAQHDSQSGNWSVEVDHLVVDTGSSR